MEVKQVLKLASIVLLLGSTGALAEEAASTEPASLDPLVLHPGDTITWDPKPGHYAMFGDEDNVSFTQIAKLLTFEEGFPCAFDDSAGVPVDEFCETGAMPKFTATVRSDLDYAALGDDAAFDFSCGIHTHMDTKLFTVEAGAADTPRRDLVITTNGTKWVITDPNGDIELNRAP